MRALLNRAGCALAMLCLLAPGTALAGWTQGQFSAYGKNVIEYHCIPAGKAPYPAVILLHGAGPRGQADASMEQICGDLADAGYYTEYIEYYSQTEDVSAGQPEKIKKYF